MHQHDCKDTHDCAGHEPGHVHGPDCGHTPHQHGDHVDYVVDGHLHHPHGDHCHDHGVVPRGDDPLTSAGSNK